MAQLPAVSSEEELADFVDTHDTAQYWDEMAPVDERVFRVRRRESYVRVPLGREAVGQLRALAKQKGVSPDDLLREWLLQRLRQEQQAA